MKKAYLVICIISLIACLTGIPNLITGIGARGMAGVNYGRILFPALIGGISFYLFKKE